MAVSCARCAATVPSSVLEDAHNWAFWRRPDGACPACVQQELLRTLLREGDEALHRSVQACWPLDAEAAFGALPTPLRLHADPRFTGRGVTLALVDSGFYPHPDLIAPVNRIVAYTDAGVPDLPVLRFGEHDVPRWPAWNAGADHQWHGTMTSVAAAGNGFLGHGLYRGLASDARVVLAKVRDPDGHITNASICRALEWLLDERSALGVGVVSLSVSGDEVPVGATDLVAELITALVDAGVTVVAAAGNSGERHLLPPASAPAALTVGGIDDHGTLDHSALSLWHSNYGMSDRGARKPELVAPSIWVVAPVLPNTRAWQEASDLFDARRAGREQADRALEDRKLVTRHYQHVDGTSFAAPLAASAVACMLDANPRLSPRQVRDLLVATARMVPGAPPERQGAGAIEPGRAVAAALAEAHDVGVGTRVSPAVVSGGVRFALHDHAAGGLEVYGSWNQWREGWPALREETGFWRTAPLALAPGEYRYKFRLDSDRWLDDPDNPDKAPDGHGGLNAVLRVF
jgi:serine protease AprX